MDPQLSWLTLKNVPGIGNLLFKKLLEYFQWPEAVLAASKNELAKVEGISTRLAEAICSHRTPSAGVKRERDRITQKGFKLVTYSDANYPKLLRQIPDPPPYLYVYGHLGPDSHKIAVVGSRRATSYGLTTTHRLCKGLVAQGLAVVSGMAYGIDSAAHRAALAAGGTTIAVLGSGLENIYPRRNRRLFHEIAQKGAVVSEFSLQAEPEAHHFPIRNRIISGMSLGTIIVEATRKSGSLITARLAAEQNREVFAVPGSIQSLESAGTHYLLKQGAKLVENVQDVLDELNCLGGGSPNTVHAAAANAAAETGKPKVPGAGTPVPSAAFTPDEARVLAALEPYPRHIDQIVRKSGMAPGALAGILLNLELRGVVIQSPGKRFAIYEEKP